MSISAFNIETESKEIKSINNDINIKVAIK